jgi:hypothetical protein
MLNHGADYPLVMLHTSYASHDHMIIAYCSSSTLVRSVPTSHVRPCQCYLTTKETNPCTRLIRIQLLPESISTFYTLLLLPLVAQPPFSQQFTRSYCYFLFYVFFFFSPPPSPPHFICVHRVCAFRNSLCKPFPTLY